MHSIVPREQHVILSSPPWSIDSPVGIAGGGCIAGSRTVGELGSQVTVRGAAPSAGVNGIYFPALRPLDGTDSTSIAFVREDPFKNSTTYFHGSISSADAERALAQGGLDDAFLLRKPDGAPYIVSVQVDPRTILHVEVRTTAGGFTFEGDEVLRGSVHPTVWELVEAEMCCGLQPGSGSSTFEGHQLKYPVGPECDLIPEAVREAPSGGSPAQPCFAILNDVTMGIKDAAGNVMYVLSTTSSVADWRASTSLASQLGPMATVPTVCSASLGSLFDRDGTVTATAATRKSSEACHATEASRTISESVRPAVKFTLGSRVTVPRHQCQVSTTLP